MLSKFVSWLEGLDRWTLAKVESFSHKVQATTGLTNFWLARCVVLVEILRELLDQHVVGLIIMIAAFLSTFLYEQDTQKRLVQGLKNELAKTLWIGRVCFLIICLSQVSFVVLLTLFVLALSATYPKETISLVVKLFELWTIVPLSPLLLTIFLYLVAVTPMPPGPSRLRKWIASLGRKKAASVA